LNTHFCVDANVFITAWYHDYPPRILLPLWEQIANHHEMIEIIKPVFNEIEPIQSNDRKLQRDKKKEKYPLRIWLEDTKFPVPEINDEVNFLSLTLEQEYETIEDSKGAGQIDITLIAYAKINNRTVVTLESPQPQIPGKKYNYKIPLICKENDVDCINFINMIDQLNISIS
jgi:predicted nucleic acid-binding protein